MARNGVIGRDNALPWRLPADLKHFKAVTWGKPMLMGRRTFESIGQALPGRTSLVLTRDSNWRAEGAVGVHSVEEAFAHAREARELACIGGAEVFQLLLPAATRIHLTRVEADISGDTFFPPIDAAEWLEVESRSQPADERNPYDMTFVTLVRSSKA